MCNWSRSLTVAGRDRAIVGGSWCEPFQCEGTCCCILHGNAVPPTSLRDTGEEVASDHPITQGRSRRGPRECNISCSTLGDCELFWGTSRSCIHVRKSIAEVVGNLQHPVNLCFSTEHYMHYKPRISSQLRLISWLTYLCGCNNCVSRKSIASHIQSWNTTVVWNAREKICQWTILRLWRLHFSYIHY